MDILRQTAHRPWPLPTRPWIMSQTWHNLLFAHWPLDPAALQAVVPPELTIDTWAGHAWLGIVVFRLSGIRLRGCPPVPFVAAFPEINVRTYVTCQGKPGVLFLSLDTDHRLAIALARPWFRLAYKYAHMQFRADGTQIHFAGRRAGDPSTAFRATYGPDGAAATPALRTLAHWLTERYCYYSVDGQRRVYCCEIHHLPWQLQPATAEIMHNSMAEAHGVPLPGTAPILHYAHRMEARIWALQHVAAGPQHRERAARREALLL